MNYTIRKNIRTGTTRINCQDKETANVFLAALAMYEALKEISEGKGRFSLDQLEHADNTIEDMKQLAIEALAKAENNPIDKAS